MEQSVAISLVIQNPLNREGFRRILIDGGFQVKGEAEKPNDLIPLPEDSGRVILLDQDLLSGDGETGISFLFARFPKCKVVVVARNYDFNLMQRVFAAGAHGYILDDVPHEAFVASIQLVTLDQRVAPAMLIDKLQDLPTDVADTEGAIGQKFSLSKREADILDLLVKGLPNKLIARELGISESTVKVANKAIFRKLSVKNRTQAAMVARENKTIASEAETPVDGANLIHFPSATRRGTMRGSSSTTAGPTPNPCVAQAGSSEDDRGKQKT